MLLESPDGPLTPEEFARSHFRALGFESLILESRPFHVLFGVFLWLVIQDPADPRNRIVGFGDRDAFERGEKGEMIWTHLPDDFGTPRYAIRRAEAIEAHFGPIMFDRDEQHWLFEYWLPYSNSLRQYLWAHSARDVERARALLDILPAADTGKILKHLIGAYWRRYLGWPDLVVYRPGEFFFAEVKSSSDRLSEDQKDWIRENHELLGFPFKLVKIHKRH